MQCACVCVCVLASRYILVYINIYQHMMMTYLTFTPLASSPGLGAWIDFFCHYGHHCHHHKLS